MKLLTGDIDGMRLYNIYYLCKQCEERVKGLTFTTVRTNQEYSINDWENYKEALFVIRQIPFLKELVDDFYETVPVFVREREKPQVDHNTYSRLNTKKNAILNRVQTVIALYESMELGETRNGIDVKIPECESLAEYIKYLKEIDFIFTQCPYLQHKEGKIEFDTVDVGSQWITFLVGTAAVTFILTNLASLVDKAIQLKSHLTSLDQQKEILETKKKQNAALDSNLEMFEVLRKHYISEAAKAIEEANNNIPLDNQEDRSRLEKSLEKLSDLLDKGVEFYASIDAPKETQVLFPVVNSTLELSENVLKLLEDKKE